jgi:saccharopine dehydrogenase-like NADP-dependent oxidoreductase
MKKILVLGAGLSASSLIKYLLDHSLQYDWKITIADKNYNLAKEKINGHENGTALDFDVFNHEQLTQSVIEHDLIISMLPASMHAEVAKACVKFKKNMVTASYASDEIKQLDKEAQENGVLILNEMGVDPGIDHMSAMDIIDRIRTRGAKLHAFESSTGGLVAPEYDNNPWNYKFTWNPRNVVLAGQGTSMFLQKGKYKYIPYHRLFKRIETVNILDFGEFEIYPNRDSLKYQEIYGLDDIGTIFRGTIRRPGYSEAWDVFVQLGVTDDSYKVKDSENMTYREFFNSFLIYEQNIPLETKLATYTGIEENSEVMDKLKWLGVFDNKKIGLKEATPAQILQHLLEQKWQLDPDDKDMIVMHHIFEYKFEGKEKRLTASMVVKGQDTTHTAMSITVGIPVAIAAKLILEGKITATGVQIPLIKEVYTPVLKELEDYGVKFIEQITEIE